MSKGLPIFNYKCIKNEASSSTVDIFIDGDIVDEPTREILADWYGDESSVSFKSLRAQVDNTVKTVNVHVNSGGGSVIDAMAAHDWLAELESNGVTVNRKGMGIIASAATYILMAPKGSKNSEISKNSFFMIHNVAGFMWGYMDANDMEKQAAVLRKFNNTVRDFYADITGKPKETISTWMNNETWFTGAEAVDNCFVGNCTGDVKFANSIKPKNWLYSNTAVLNAYNSSTVTPAKEKTDKSMKKNAIINAITEAFTKLGLTNDASLSTVKVTDLKNALTASLEAAEDEPVDEAAITNAVKNAMNPAAINESVTAAINALIAAKDNAISVAINTAVTDATKDFVSNEAMEKVTNDLAEKLGSKRIHNRDKGEQAEKVDATNHAGIKWGADAE